MRRYDFNKHTYVFDNYQTPSSRQFYLVSIACVLNIVFFCFLIISLCSCSLNIQMIDVKKIGDKDDTITQKIKDGFNE